MSESKLAIENIPALSPDVTEEDDERYLQLVSTELSEEQRRRIVEPAKVYYQQDSILALHWHPEFVPMDLVEQRIRATFPNSDLELIIPTQHNRLVTFDGRAGAEVDCYSKGFTRKVQLLAHFEESRVADADVFKGMLAHTFKYRSSQLDEFIDSITDTKFNDRLYMAAAKTGADKELIEFVQVGTQKLKNLIEKHYAATPPEMLRNKIIQWFFDSYRGSINDEFVDRVQVFLKAIKKIVKKQFSPTHFYETEEVIEEIRSLGGCIVIPHPEQFWPILLADYDVDALEVWNPQSREYTNFLISVVDRLNNRDRRSKHPLLITMGDDCHMGEKAKPPEYQDAEKASREIGVQPAWDDLSIRKNLVTARMNRRLTIEEYKSRLHQ